MKKLSEGLKTGDLNDLVLKTISIDEFNSKIDNETAIVIGFYVDDKEPANDLRNFLDKSATELLDSDRSPAPDLDGNYMVFVEFERNDKFPEELLTMVETIENLVDNTDWEFTVYKNKGPYPLTLENLKKYVRLEPKEEKDDFEESFQHSLVDSVILEDNILTMTKGTMVESFIVVRAGPFEQLQVAISESNYNLSKDRRLKNTLRKILGESWDISVNNENIVIYNTIVDYALILKEEY